VKINTYELSHPDLLIVSSGPSQPPLLGITHTLMNTFDVLSDQNGREDPRSRFWEHGSLRYTRPQLWQVDVPAESAWNQKSKARRIRSTDLCRAVPNGWNFYWCSCRTPQLKEFFRLSADWRLSPNRGDQCLPDKPVSNSTKVQRFGVRFFLSQFGDRHGAHSSL
jgi:hypothetical protein